MDRNCMTPNTQWALIPKEANLPEEKQQQLHRLIRDYLDGAPRTSEVTHSGIPLAKPEIMPLLDMLVISGFRGRILLSLDV